MSSAIQDSSRRSVKSIRQQLLRPQHKHNGQHQCGKQLATNSSLPDADFDLIARAGKAHPIIAQRCEFSDAVQETKISNLWVLPCGTLPPDPGELLTSPRFPELLEMLKEKYDYVLVDTPPLLAVTDPCVVAPRVDGVLLTVRILKNGRQQARRAKEILGTLDVNLLGIVVNGLGRSSGDYNYGYGENYAYDQGYGNANADQEALDPNDGESHQNGQGVTGRETLVS